MKSIISIFTLFIIVFFNGCNSSDEAKTIVEDNKSFNELKALGNKTYSLVTTDGKDLKITVENDILSSKELKGKIVLVNFWATWCPPCIKEIPIFNELTEKYKDKLVIVGVLFEKNKDPKELEEFMNKYNIKFPITVGDENFRMAKAFNNVQKVPESYLYGKDGKYVKDYIGEVDKNDIEEYLNSH